MNLPDTTVHSDSAPTETYSDAEEMTKFHVTFGERKKLVNVEDLRNLKFLIRKAFSIKSKFSLQRFIPEVDDWVDIEGQTEICHSESFVKIKVILLPNDQETNEEKASLDLSMESDCSAEMSCDNGGQDWLFFPKYAVPVQTLEKLENKVALTKKDEFSLADAFYVHAAKNKKYYPKTTEYRKMGRLLLEKYPHLTKENMVDALDFWREKIIHRFQNARKRIDQQSEEVIKRKERYRVLKEKRKEADDSPSDIMLQENDAKKVKPSENSEKPTTLQYGLANYSPTLSAHEDCHSVKTLLKSMNNEMSSKAPNMQKVDMIMERTFALRRQYILAEQPDIEDILEQYPVLHKPQELIKDFRRLKPHGRLSNDVTSVVTEALISNERALLDAVSGRGNSLLNALQNITVDQQERKVVRGCTALLCLPHLLDECPELLFAKEMEDSQKALISFKSNIPFKESVVNLENVSIRCSNIFEAVAVVIAATYLFNLKYPDGLQETFNFLEVGLLDFKHGQKLSKKAQSLLKLI